ncbi:hypothetical protein P280DRAFT_483143 [Massarina eburnea CBS 473.64]|uniref:Uncharacterized protein n=1 Tax=Massarina eburnea CBS 473.64 TaxID=1395130 RepID=A0A6A6RTB2_9PLEO|nr:hypothetical protein P280DRAFT_483143 [Massarina eburnea CBS 473.64]
MSCWQDAFPGRISCCRGYYLLAEECEHFILLVTGGCGYTYSPWCSYGMVENKGPITSNPTFKGKCWECMGIRMEDHEVYKEQVVNYGIPVHEHNYHSSRVLLWRQPIPQLDEFYDVTGHPEYNDKEQHTFLSRFSRPKRHFPPPSPAPRRALTEAEIKDAGLRKQRRNERAKIRKTWEDAGNPLPENEFTRRSLRDTTPSSGTQPQHILQHRQQIKVTATNSIPTSSPTPTPALISTATSIQSQSSATTTNSIAVSLSTKPDTII